MQKETTRPGTPKLNSTNRRPRNNGTPENRHRTASGNHNAPTMNRATNLRNRATMAPGDILIPPGLVTNRRIGNATSLNATLSQISGQGPVRCEFVENPENELGFLYDKYLQAKATEILVKNKISQKERTMMIQMVAVSKEREIAKENLENVKMRENEINYANIKQISIDAQIAERVACFDELRRYKVKEKLLQLKTLLEPLDELRCPGIIIPENIEDYEKFLESLEKINELLKNLTESNGDKGNVYKKLENGLNNLRSKHAEIEGIKKKFDEILCGLQVLVLKDASHSLSQNYADESCHNLSK